MNFAAVNASPVVIVLSSISGSSSISGDGGDGIGSDGTSSCGSSSKTLTWTGNNK